MADDDDGLTCRGNPEIGSLTASSPYESHFIGSSSGVYFVNTVKKAFAFSFPAIDGIPAATETVGGTEDAASSRPAGQDADSTICHLLDVDPEQNAMTVVAKAQLGALPPKDEARRLVTEYFRHWHSLFPFLTGSRILADLDELYRDGRLRTPGLSQLNRHQSCRLLIFMCVFGIGATHLPASAVVPSHRSLSASEAFATAAALGTRHDTLTIQMMLAAQLFCVVKMALMTASSLGGLAQRLITHAGLHRCPFRYAHFDDGERDLRKRIFWSSYVLDRYLSQSLGLPLTIADADVDVCVPTAREVHDPSNPLARRDFLSHASKSLEQRPLHFQLAGSSADHPPSSGLSRETVLANYIEHCRLVGRALELYHKSIHVRSVRQAQALYLRSDIDRWFNNLPQDLQVGSLRSESQQSPPSNASRFAIFFAVLYQQIIILVHRPSLSVDRSLPEFQSGLQIALSAARATLTMLEQHDHLAWPGSLSAVWMSGLIIAFACQVQSYTRSKGSWEIARCAHLLETMKPQWPIAQRCHATLMVLLAELRQTSFGDQAGSRHGSKTESLSHSSDFGSNERASENTIESRKRPRYESINSGQKPGDNRSHAKSYVEVNCSSTPSQIPYSRPESSGQQQSHRELETAEGTRRPNKELLDDFMETIDATDPFRDIAWENLFDFNYPHTDEHLL